MATLQNLTQLTEGTARVTQQGSDENTRPGSPVPPAPPPTPEPAAAPEAAPQTPPPTPTTSRRPLSYYNGLYIPPYDDDFMTPRITAPTPELEVPAYPFAGVVPKMEQTSRWGGFDDMFYPFPFH